MERYYKIAGLTVKMDTYGRTVEQSRQYEIDPQANFDIEIRSTRDEIKSRHPHIEDDIAEYLGSGSSFYRQLLMFDGFMLHSSAIVVENRAYLFSANCGTGKSTHTKLWKEIFEDKAYILNDDKPALRYEDGVWYAYGTPWSGKYDINENNKVPLAGIAFLKRAEENHISRVKSAEVVAALLKQTYRPKDAISRIQLLELFDKLMSNIPIWELNCNMTTDAVAVSCNAMSCGSLRIPEGKGSNICISK